MQVGQINFNNSGKRIYELSLRKDVENIVEIGTWNGLGSTLCILKAIVNSNENKNFLSIELMTKMYEEAIINLKEISKIDGVDYLNKVQLLNGSIIDYKDVFWFDHNIVKNCIDSGIDDIENGISANHERLYYEQEMLTLKNSTNFFKKMPDKIDLLILDGGGFTTYPEWQKLKDRTKIVVLDDTLTMKCKKIRQEILEDNNYITIMDDLDERVGFSIFERK